MKNSCVSISKRLEPYFDQELTGEERRQVDEHLRECRTCQESFKLMERIRGAIKQPVDGAVEKEDFQLMWQNIQREIRLRESPSWLESIRVWLDISPLLRKKVWIPALATMAILVFVTVPILFKKSPSPSVLSVVEYVDSPTYNVMVYESEKPEVTVIWLFEGQGEELSTS